MKKAPTSADDEFRDYVEARSAGLHRIAYLLSGDWSTAEDLVQTALTKTYLSWSRIRDRESIDAYARRVLYNTNVSWWRKRSNREQPVDRFPDRGAADDFTEELARREYMWKQVATLPKRQRAVIVLRYYENKTDKDIAAFLGVSLGTVKSQASRALASLRKRMGATIETDFGRRRSTIAGEAS
ncbi:SigE family RNA polymerase sigma factor [Salininema proteolyticum]|uniref:SigE family RNA polymerase sigma factor n=1 Tax=Salininema proteolyticum TaxID=1607685 RepID=A0ABV8TWP4_9ACTN